MGEQALELEAEAGRHPDWAGELLLDAARASRQAGEQERAIVVLRELVASGGEDGLFAQVLLAQVYVEFGRDDDARAPCCTSMRRWQPNGGNEHGVD